MITRPATKCFHSATVFNPLSAELNLICHLLALLGNHHNLHVSRIRVKCHLAINSTRLITIAVRSSVMNMHATLNCCLKFPRRKCFLKFDTDRFYNNLRIISPSLLQVLTAHTNIATRLTDVTKNVDIHLIHIQTTPNFS